MVHLLLEPNRSGINDKNPMLAPPSTGRTGSAIDFPAFTSGTTYAHGYCHTPTIQVPVEAGGLARNPGDLRHGHCNGVTSIRLFIGLYENISRTSPVCCCHAFKSFLIAATRFR
jgi:hypothetical protein